MFAVYAEFVKTVFLDTLIRGLQQYFLIQHMNNPHHADTMKIIIRILNMIKGNHM